MPLFDDRELKDIGESREKWERNVLEEYREKRNFQLPEFRSSSGIPTKYIYTPEDIKDFTFKKLGMPGEYPYTRGLEPLGYQYAPWMHQQVHGYGLPDQTRGRMEELIRAGMMGYGQPVLLVEIDLATTFGLDPDDPLASGSVGVAGVNICKLDDYEILFDGFDLSRTRVCITTKGINCPVILAQYLVYAEGRGYKFNELNGQSQNRPKITWLFANVRGFPPREALKMQIELIKFTSLNMPKWNHTNLCGYLAAEAGANSIQEVAIVLSETINLIEAAIEAGIDPNDMVPRLSAQMAFPIDIMEGVAKMRAIRRMWAKIMKERFGLKNPRAYKFRIHAHTSGSAMCAQQPLNNIVRAALQAFGAALAGVQSMHVTSYDEAISLPSEEAARLALRTMQIIQHETNITHVTDPLGGSYYIEAITDRIEEEAWKIIGKIDELGGFIRCMETGWIRDMVDQEALKWREAFDRGEIVKVGANKYREEREQEISVFNIDQERIEEIAIRRVKEWKKNRDQRAVKEALKRIEEAARGYETIKQAGNIIPVLIEGARARCTMGEMQKVLFDVFGTAIS